MTNRKEQTHYHANSRTIAVQNFKLLYWFVHKHGCAHMASVLEFIVNLELTNSALDPAKYKLGTGPDINQFRPRRVTDDTTEM